MIFLSQLKDPRWKPQDCHIIKWPNGDTFWYDALMGQYCPCPPSIFDGGDAYELEDPDWEELDDERRLPWRL